MNIKLVCIYRSHIQTLSLMQGDIHVFLNVSFSSVCVQCWWFCVYSNMKLMEHRRKLNAKVGIRAESRTLNTCNQFCLWPYTHTQTHTLTHTHAQPEPGVDRLRVWVIEVSLNKVILHLMPFRVKSFSTDVIWSLLVAPVYSSVQLELFVAYHKLISITNNHNCTIGSKSALFTACE